MGARCCGVGQQWVEERCEGAPTACASGLEPTADGCVPARRRVEIPEGRLDLAPRDWDAMGRVEPRQADVAAFRIDAHEVTASRYASCVDDGACKAGPVPREPGRPITDVSRDEAAAFCRWAGGRLPTLDELAFAAAGAEGRRYPWGGTGAVCRRAAWGLQAGPCAEGATGPEIAGSHPDGHTPEGIADLAGNVAEWTQTLASELDDRAGDEAVVFGGTYADQAALELRTWYRQTADPAARSSTIGFRCAYAPEPSPDPVESR